MGYKCFEPVALAVQEGLRIQKTKAQLVGSRQEVKWN